MQQRKGRKGRHDAIANTRGDSPGSAGGIVNASMTPSHLVVWERKGRMFVRELPAVRGTGWEIKGDRKSSGIS